jgi:hypothetical protein
VISSQTQKKNKKERVKPSKKLLKMYLNNKLTQGNLPMIIDEVDDLIQEFKEAERELKNEKVEFKKSETNSDDAKVHWIHDVELLENLVEQGIQSAFTLIAELINEMEEVGTSEAMVIQKGEESKQKIVDLKKQMDRIIERKEELSKKLKKMQKAKKKWDRKVKKLNKKSKEVVPEEVQKLATPATDAELKDVESDNESLSEMIEARRRHLNAVYSSDEDSSVVSFLTGFIQISNVFF